MSAGKIDFKRIADAALSRAEQLVPAWLSKGKRASGSHEWVVGGLDNSEGASLSINLRTGVWADFAGDDADKGGDLISLYAAVYGLDQADAARELGELLGIEVPPKKGDKPAGERKRPAPPPPDLSQAAKPAKEKTPWKPILPVPADAPPPHAAHPVRGKPERTWEYRDRDASGEIVTLGYAYRFITSDGGKEVIPHTYCENEKTKKREWRWVSFPEPRPLYRLEHLSDAGSGRVVLVVEGEKCADAAALRPGIAERFDVVSWPGGGKAADRANWARLAGRRVVVWPDADAEFDKKADPPVLKPEEKQDGVRAAEKIAGALSAWTATVRIIKIPPPGEKKNGWDIADAIDEGWTDDQLLDFMRNQRPPAKREDPEEKQAGGGKPPGGKPPPGKGGAGGGDGDEYHWSYSLIYKKGEIASCSANVHDILLQDEAWKGVFSYDQFAQRTFKRVPPPLYAGEAGEWTGHDDELTGMWLARKYNFTPSTTLVGASVEALSRRFSYHPVRDWLRAQKWDGEPRLDHWLDDVCGVPVTEYTRRVARWYLIGMVARVMRPGVKFDYCLVLEGLQGKGKSSVLGILGGEWFADTDLDLGNKDSMSALAGVWLYEFAELGALARAESLKQKSFLSRQKDRYRPVYGRREIDVPRQCVFGGSTNEWEWNKDPTGGRRFWPVEVGELQLDLLREHRGQLFAEAVAAFAAGERFWPTYQEQREIFDPEQLKREHQEPYVDLLHDWVEQRLTRFSLADAALHLPGVDAGRMSRDVVTRVGIALRKLGCTRVEQRNGMVRYWYEPPKKSAESADPIAHMQQQRHQSEYKGGQDVDDDNPIPF